MESIVGIFNSFADAKRASAILRTLGIPDNRITALSPHTTEAELEAQIPTTETEQPGMGAALGGTVGAALGTAGGLEAGAAAAVATPTVVAPAQYLMLFQVRVDGVLPIVSRVAEDPVFRTVLRDGET